MRCQVHYVRPDFCLKPHNIPFNDLYELVQQNLKKLFSALKNEDEIINAVRNRSDIGRKAEKLNAEKAKNEQRLSALSKIIIKLYEDHVGELLDISNYQMLLKKYQQEQKALNARAVEIDNELQNQNDVNTNVLKFKDATSKFINCEELTKEMLNRLIEKIVVGDKRKTDKGYEQEVRIIYRFINTTID